MDDREVVTDGARKRDQRIQLQTDDTSYVCAKSFHLYRRHYSPTAMKNEKKRRETINFSAVVFFIDDFRIVRSLSFNKWIHYIHLIASEPVSRCGEMMENVEKKTFIAAMAIYTYSRESTQNKHLTHELDANQRQINANIFWTDSHRKPTHTHTHRMEES